MRSAIPSIVWLAALSLFIACSQGGGANPGLRDAGPLVAQFAEAGRDLQGLGAAMAQRDGSQKVPSTFISRLQALGDAAYAVLQQAEPTGSAGANAIQTELATASSDVIRHLVTTEGGTQDGTHKLLSAEPQQVGFLVDEPARPLDAVGSERGKNTARMRLKAALSLEIEHFIYTAVLANAAARAKFCLRCDPQHLATANDPPLEVSSVATDEWRRSLFDEANRLVLPTPFSARWAAFQDWARAVNPMLQDAVHRTRQVAFDRLYL